MIRQHLEEDADDGICDGLEELNCSSPLCVSGKTKSCVGGVWGIKSHGT